MASSPAIGVEGLELGEDPLCRLDVPGGIDVDSDPRLEADRVAHRAHLAEVISGAELQLEGRKALLGPAKGIIGHGGGWPGNQRRVAADRLAAFAVCGAGADKQ